MATLLSAMEITGRYGRRGYEVKIDGITIFFSNQEYSYILELAWASHKTDFGALANKDSFSAESTNKNSAAHNLARRVRDRLPSGNILEVTDKGYRLTDRYQKQAMVSRAVLDIHTIDPRILKRLRDLLDGQSASD